MWKGIFEVTISFKTKFIGVINQPTTVPQFRLAILEYQPRMPFLVDLVI